MTKYNDLERIVSLQNENSEVVELRVETSGDAMRVDLSIPAYSEGGVVKVPRQCLEFTSAEWDRVVEEVEKCRAARSIFGMSA